MTFWREIQLFVFHEVQQGMEACGVLHVCFMLPDFSHLRKEERDGEACQGHRTSAQSAKPSHSQGFDPTNKHQHSDTKQQDTRPQRNFFDLWVAQPSWSPIILTDRGWKTITAGQKKVPLVLGTIESNYRRGHILAKRFGQLTEYLLIDVDIHSPFHPSNQGLKPILDAMEAIGLCRYLIVRSSDSGGLHLYFPLPTAVNSYQLACAAHSSLTAHYVTIKGGTCELFPNKKAYNAEHNGHRLPLQRGSYLLDDDFGCIGNDKKLFVAHWQTAAAAQDFETLQLALAGHLIVHPDEIATAKPPRSPSPNQRQLAIPPIAWTHYGQSNDIMRELVNYGDRYVGLKNATDLAAWVKAVAPLLPGYDQYASPKSKQDIEHGSWAMRWSLSHFRSAWLYRMKGTDHNTKVARDAKYRIFASLERMCVDINIGITELWKQVRDSSKIWFNIGVAMETFKKYETEIWAYIRGTGDLTPSKRNEEGKNSSSKTTLKAKNLEPDLELEKSSKQLLTLRCRIAIASKIVALFDTPKTVISEGDSRAEKTASDLHQKSVTDESVQTESKRNDTEPDKGKAKDDGKAEQSPVAIAAGVFVRVAMPGTTLDGVEAMVRAQTIDVLGQPVYELDYERQGRSVRLPAECLQVVKVKPEAHTTETAVGVIRATAQQLRQVLGKACPFVGPGLWTVRKRELSPHAWQRLIAIAEGT